MSYAFNPGAGLVVVHTEIQGPTATALVDLALDTGASGTLIDTTVLMTIGCDPALSAQRSKITTASGIEYLSSVILPQINALGLRRKAFPVLCHTLPPSAGIVGLLGLDFLRGTCISLDFRQGRITLDASS